ncbi:hypothetical protein SNEBB_009799 [Seison nebaliae]|nr:hypothetical protein SNEBB_009799 [Seison nebaliae]
MVLDGYKNTHWYHPINNYLLLSSLCRMERVEEKKLKKIYEIEQSKIFCKGNCGTSGKIIEELIVNCKISKNALSKLNLIKGFVSPKIHHNEIFYDYFPVKKKKNQILFPSILFTSNHFRIIKSTNKKRLNLLNQLNDKRFTTQKIYGTTEEKYVNYLPDNGEKEIISLNDQHYLQDREKFKRFEKDVEVTWEKGSSGLVFYMDDDHVWNPSMNDIDEISSNEEDLFPESYDSDDEDNERNVKEKESILKEIRIEGEETVKKIKRIDYENEDNIGRRLLKLNGWEEGKCFGQKGNGLTSSINVFSGDIRINDRSGIGIEIKRKKI